MMAGMGGMVGGDPKALQPGSWTCPACGNLNYAGRSQCNARACGRPRPKDAGAFAGAAVATRWDQGMPGSMAPIDRHAAAGMPGMMQNMMCQPVMQQQMPSSMFGTQPPTSTPPVGSWRCLVCDNVNWPSRDTCNGKNCGQPRHAVDGGPVGPNPAPKATRPAPEGSWICLACNNINWPQRDTCNGRNCGRPRAAVDGGAPPPNAMVSPGSEPPPAMGVLPDNAPIGGHPAGSWQCPVCNNINYPNRTSCNKKGCGMPRP